MRGLYAVTPDGLPFERLAALASAALAGGVRLVQYRSKESAIELRRHQAAALLKLCRAAGAQLVINDDLALALELDADGVHLGRDDGDPAAARRALGSGRILGVSCYGDLAAAEAAAAAGADYLAFGSVFASSTKPQAPVIPLELLGQAKRRFGLPVAAIGGITLDNAARTIAAGADLLAVIADLFDAGDAGDAAAVGARARNYQKLFD